MNIKFVTLILAVLIGSQLMHGWANVTPAKIFSSNMVLQKGIENSIWGWADKNELIYISLNGKTIKTKAGKDGKWVAKLPVMDYGGPYKLTIQGKNKIELNNIMIGEVWICSGQSNMQWNVANSNNATEEIASADYPEIRIFQVPRSIAQTPQDDILTGNWKICSSQSIPEFSAIGYFFARNLYQQLKIPIGIIESDWGGTVAETWISSQTIQKDPDFAEKLEQLNNCDLNKEEALREKRIKELLGDHIPTEDLGIVNDKPVWGSANYDDSSWKSILAPKFWEEQGYTNFDGIAYYRKEINLNETQIKNIASLHLGKVDDSDMTWMNGSLLGKTLNASSIDRIYNIDPQCLKPGKNILLVRVLDNGGKGGIWGNPENLFLSIGNEKINLSGNWKFRFEKPILISDFQPNQYPTLLFNAMINPIIPYGIKGAIWYQGESNADRAQQYQRIFPALISDWRNHWGLGDFPFIWVQLANFMKPAEVPENSSWAELREAQEMTLRLPNTGMATAIDIGDANDIHPKNKQEVGRRLALNALKMSYGKNIVAIGPMYQRIEIKDHSITVFFKETGSKLQVKNKYGYINGFTIAGADQKFYWAKATLVNDNTVKVSSDLVQNPVAVRYGWANNPDDLNLINQDGLPAIPFRSDNWPSKKNK